MQLAPEVGAVLWEKPLICGVHANSSVRIELTCRTLSWYLRDLLGVGRKRTHFECSSSGVRVKGKHIGEVFCSIRSLKEFKLAIVP